MGNEVESVKEASNPDMQQAFILEDIMIEIFSWLPVESLARFKCMSKKVCSLIDERHFIRKHVSRAPTSKTEKLFNVNRTGLPTTDDPKIKETFRLICGCDGLVVKRNNKSGIYHIENPTTRKKLILPSPLEASSSMSLFFISGEYKLVSVIDEKSSKTGNQGCEVLNVGADDSYWRYLQLPKSADENKDRMIEVVESAGEAYHFIVSIKNGSHYYLDEVISLDLITERYITTCIPSGVSTSHGPFWKVDWDGHLSLVEWMDKSMNVWVLEDFRKHEWYVKKILFGSQLCAQADVMNCVPLFRKGDDLWVWVKDEKIFSWDIESKNITCSCKAREGYNITSKIYVCPRSLVSIKGMIHDDDTK